MTNSTIKKISLGAAGVLTAGLFGFLFKSFIGAAGMGNLILALAGSVLFLAVFLLQTILASDVRISPAVIVLEVLAMAVFFFGNISLIFLIGMLINLGFLIAAHYSGGIELKTTLDIHFSKTSRVIMAFATLALALFASFTYVGTFDLKNPAAAKRSLEVIIRPFEPLVARYIPNFSSRNTIKDIATAVLPADFRLAPADQKAQAVSQISARLAETISGFAGVQVQIADRIIDILYKATVGKVVTLSPAMQTVVLSGFGVLFFFFLKFLLFFVDWAAVLVGYGLYSLLKTFEFFRIEMHDVPKRVIVLE